MFVISKNTYHKTRIATDLKSSEIFTSEQAWLSGLPTDFSRYKGIKYIVLRFLVFVWYLKKYLS